MKYEAIYNEEPIIFSDLHSAKMGCKELGLKWFYPITDIFCSEPVKTMFVKLNGKWVEKDITEMKCTCGCNL